MRQTETAAAHDAIPETALAWARDGRGAALATVVQTWGSAPRPVGAQLAVSGRGEIAGSVSGGCVEGAVVEEALVALEDGRCRILEFGVTDEEAFAVGLACGGTIRVMVEPLGRGQGPATTLIADLVAARAERRSVALLTDTESWARRLVAHGQDAGLDERLRAGRSGFDGAQFVGVHAAPLRLVVVGAVHIAQPLVAMARLMGLDPVVVDPREAFASPDRFPGERLIHDWPDEALAGLGLDARSAIVTLTHDPKLDDPAIMAALAAPVAYLGCLGSTRTHARRLERLRAAGLDDAALARIHAPVGLPIGAASPAEIAVSILAQIVAVVRGR
ncbi:MAG: XdhC family protein [Rhodobacteraceae bacterium]|nr:XdhC family protein [Paracoccaceae bacterium]